MSFATDDGRLREGLTRMAAFVERVKNVDVPIKNNEQVEVPTEPVEDREPAFNRA